MRLGDTPRSVGAIPRGMASSAGEAVGGVLQRLNPGRRQRRVWVGDGRAHIEVRAVHRPGHEDVARHLEHVLEDVEGVHWAQVNAVVGRVVVVFDPDGPSLDDLLDVVDGVEEAHDISNERFPHDRPEHPGDIEPIRRNAIALGADVLGLGASVLGQLLRVVPLPVEIVSLVSLAENEPRVRRFLEQHLGVPVTDLGLGITNAFGQALSQGPLGLVVDMAHRANVVGELQARRELWERREPELHPERTDVAPDALEHEVRPTPLPSGPVERYADGAALASLGAFGMALAVTRSPRRAAAAFVAGLPKAARLGREAFAAHLGRELAQRDVVVLDGTVLRRLDRLDAVVFDADVLVTDRCELGEIDAFGGPGTSEVRARASALFDPAKPDRVRRRGAWVMGPLPALEALGVVAPRGSATRARTLGRGRAGVLGVGWRGALVGMVAFETVLDPLAEPLTTTALRNGLEVAIAGAPRRLADRLGVQRTLPGGRRLRASVRSLQEEGKGVLLVSGRDAHGALGAADCAIGVEGRGSHPPWSADLLTGPGLTHVHLVVEAVSVARRVSARSAVLALAGSGVGGLWSVLGPAGSAGRRAALPMNAAALVAQAQGVVSAIALGHRPVVVPRSQTPWHTMEGPAVLKALGATSAGLTTAEALRRQVDHHREPPSLVRLTEAVGAELMNPFTPVLGVGAALAAAVGSVADAGLVAGVTVANAVIGGVQRFRAEVSIERLLQTSNTVVDVRRSGKMVAVGRDELVCGDVVELTAGDVVPADCRILEVELCEVDESALTGESLPVTKHAGVVQGNMLTDRACMLYEGTTISSGTALVVVVAVGSDTEVGRSLADAPEPPASGVEARLGTLMALTVPATVASGAAVTGLSLMRGRPLRRAVSSGVSLMVAAVPEGLPLLATVAQLAAADRLSKRGALVRNPRAIEALGRVDTLCFDKTGTLTLGEIALQRVSDGHSDEPLEALGALSRAVLAAALRASPEANGSDVVLLPHATDRAVIAAAEGARISASDGLGGWSILGELAFDPARGFHAVIGDSPQGPRVSVKGAPEVIHPRCATWLSPEGPVPIDRGVRRRLDAEVERLARRGLRVLAVAERAASTRTEVAEERVADMELLGFLGFADSVRPTAAAAVSALRAAGVDVVMITGDHPSTADAIATELGILNGSRVLTGPELETMTDAELDAALPGTSVFARVTPTHKVRIVRAYQRVGRVVAMTGDGANDAPAIRLAHTGIALGGRGSPAAREAADLIVLDDRIETILDAIIEGRGTWTSVRDALAILVGGNLGEVAFTLAATAISGDSPLGARQLLLVNLLTDMLPAMTIALRPPANRSPDVLLHEGPDESLGSALIEQIALRATMTTAGATGAWLMARSTGTRRRASTVALIALVGSQLGQTAVVGGTSPVVLASTIVSAGALFGIVQTPGISQFFGCTPLGPVGWSIAAGSAAAATAASVIVPWGAKRMVGTWVPERADADLCSEGSR